MTTNKTDIIVWAFLALLWLYIAARLVTGAICKTINFFRKDREHGRTTSGHAGTPRKP